MNGRIFAVLLCLPLAAQVRFREPARQFRVRGCSPSEGRRAAPHAAMGLPRGLPSFAGHGAGSRSVIGAAATSGNSLIRRVAVGDASPGKEIGRRRVGGPLITS